MTTYGARDCVIVGVGEPEGRWSARGNDKRRAADPTHEADVIINSRLPPHKLPACRIRYAAMSMTWIAPSRAHYVHIWQLERKARF